MKIENKITEDMIESSELMVLWGTVVQWKIEKFFDLRVEVDYAVSSPHFSLSDTEWFLQIFTDGETRVNIPGWIGLYLWKEPSITAHRVAFRVEIKRTDGSMIKVYDAEETFEKEKYSWGWSKFIKRSELLEAKDDVTVDGTLTVLCSARIVNESMGSSTSKSAPLSTVVKTAEASSQTPDGISTLIGNFKDLYISKLGSDVKIIVKGREFLAHRSVLTARSTVFASMFNSDMTEKNNGIVEITDCDPDSFENFLFFLYTGKLDIVSSNNATSLYKTSDKYDLKELKEECIRCMINELTVDSLCDVFQIAITYNDIGVFKASTNFFLENAKDILVTLKWQTFSAENHTLSNELFLKYVSKHKKD